jgi:hypothetical protein
VTITVPFSCPRTVAANSDRVMLKKRAARAMGRREYSTPFQAEVAATEGSSRGGSYREAHRFGVSFTAVSNASSGICVDPLFYLCSGLRGPLMPRRTRRVLARFQPKSFSFRCLRRSCGGILQKPFHCGSSLTGCSQPRASTSHPCRTAGKTNRRKIQGGFSEIDIDMTCGPH